MSGYVYAAQSGVEPVSAADAGQWGNAALYSVQSGCALTPSIGAMTVDLAAGVLVHFGARVTVAAAPAGFTLVSDPTYPRWTWLCLSSAGAPVVVSGDPAAVPSVPSYGDRVPLALYLVQAAQTVANNVVYKINKQVPSPMALPVYNYKTSTQVFTTNTTYADVAGANAATFAFAIAASEVWEVEYWIPLSFGGTGGAKFQLTGPGTPTNVDITGIKQQIGAGDATDNTAAEITTGIVPVAAFSASIAAADSINSLIPSGVGKYYQSTNSAFVLIKARIINGANAGTVTLQAAQNSSNSTTTLGIGSYMRAERIK